MGLGDDVVEDFLHPALEERAGTMLDRVVPDLAVAGCSSVEGGSYPERLPVAPLLAGCRLEPGLSIPPGAVWLVVDSQVDSRAGGGYSPEFGRSRSSDNEGTDFLRGDRPICLDCSSRAQSLCPEERKHGYDYCRQHEFLD